jgi:hypothetical protein
MKMKLFSTFIFSIFFLTACMNGINPKEHVGEIYRLALDEMMGKDTALNSHMKYIAIDLGNFVELNQQDKKEIFRFFEKKYKVKVMEASFAELKEKGLYNPDTMVLDGVLLKLDKVSFKFNKNILFEGSKYRSGTGAIGIEITVYYKDGKWQIKESEMTWIS